MVFGERTEQTNDIGERRMRLPEFRWPKALEPGYSSHVKCVSPARVAVLAALASFLLGSDAYAIEQAFEPIEPTASEAEAAIGQRQPSLSV